MQRTELVASRSSISTHKVRRCFPSNRDLLLDLQCFSEKKWRLYVIPRVTQVVILYSYEVYSVQAITLFNHDVIFKFKVED